MARLGYEHSNGYGASNAAVWAMTNGLRVERAGQNTQAVRHVTVPLEAVRCDIARAARRGNVAVMLPARR